VSRQNPVKLVHAAVIALVDVSVADTKASGMTAPLASVTVPEMLAVVRCANRTVGTKRNDITPTRQLRVQHLLQCLRPVYSTTPITTRFFSTDFRNLTTLLDLVSRPS
jgi:hypothetical protein